MENAVLAAGSGTTGERFGTRVRASRASGQDSVEFCRRGDRGVWSLLRQRRTVAKVPDLNIDQCLGQQERSSEHICRKAEMIEAALFPELGVGGFLRLDFLKRVFRHLVDAAHLVGERMLRIVEEIAAVADIVRHRLESGSVALGEFLCRVLIVTRERLVGGVGDAVF